VRIAHVSSAPQPVIHRFSSLREGLDESFLNARLNRARDYDRIAGYFTSGLLEVAGEALESVTGTVRIVCNSQLDPRDVQTARSAQLAMRREWVASAPERLAEHSRERFIRLDHLLRSGTLEIKVLPDHAFGLVHGKAGVITLQNGQKTAFLGSVNETRAAWQRNYELLWEDDSDEAIQWVEAEFNALWHHPLCTPLADFVATDIGRLARRRVIANIAQWRTAPDPAAPIIETPVYRQEFGLWQHQKYFINRAFEAHKTPYGARLLLADMVGLGKTVQLGFAAMLMALYGREPILILTPKSVMWQWQAELRDLLGAPSAVWDGKQWIEENGIPHPTRNTDGIRNCPRRIGIVSQGLITSGSKAAQHLAALRYECIIVDEAHRARRRNLGPGREGEEMEPNKLLAFLLSTAPRARSVLLASATPVQLYPVEGLDLLRVLAAGDQCQQVLGNRWSRWRQYVQMAIGVSVGAAEMPSDDYERWSWIRNPFPTASEGHDFMVLRRALGLSPDEPVAPSEAWERARPMDKSRIRRISRDFGRMHNPFIRHIVRRTRGYLETTIDPHTNEPFLKPVRVELFGERDDEALALTPYLKDAYDTAEEFCRLIAARARGAGFLRTLLLRRLGSTIDAGRRTARRMLLEWQPLPDAHSRDQVLRADTQRLRTLTAPERSLLQRFLNNLEANQDRDPKYDATLKYLVGKGWLERGCIVFSQYLASVRWLAKELSARELHQEPLGIYAGSNHSGIMLRGVFTPSSREDIKEKVRRGEIRLLLGTDAASEGLNLQRLGTLINLDLPWNPTRLEQRKGRIQRIGQLQDVVSIYNMRYRGSVEDRVHQMLSVRLQGIYDLFGQVPDVLEDVWVDVAIGRIEEAKSRIGAIPQHHPFSLKYEQHVEPVDWESCATVLNSQERTRVLLDGWR
jgi:superfamily II DNA or RNA helicase